jgi:hypothetical protein
MRTKSTSPNLENYFLTKPTKNSVMPIKRNYTKIADGTTLVRRPRSTNEIPVNGQTNGSMPNNEKDAFTFPLATLRSIILSLKSLYNDVDEAKLTKLLTGSK